MHAPKVLTAALVALFVGGSSASADVDLTLQNGRVSVVATDATVRDILDEWARVGHVTVTNLERVTGAPVTLQLLDVPEQQALDVLLRMVSGYLAIERSTATAGSSVFDRIIVMPPSVGPQSAPSGPAAGGRPPMSAPFFGQPGQQFPPPQQPNDDAANDEPPTPSIPNVPGGTRGPVFSTFPAPQVVNPQQQQAPLELPQAGPAATAPPTAAYPGAPTGTMPTGVSTPGMMVPNPQRTPTPPPNE